MECVSRALGARFYPATSVASLHLGDFEIRVKPDGGNDIVPQQSKVILEIKCPYSKNMRNQIGTRMQLHARQCLLELLAYPEAACLVFAVLNYAPSTDVRHRSRDSVLHRLDRTIAVEALEELERHGLANDLAKDVPNPKVDAVLQRMVSTAIELPKVARLKTATAATLLPELFDAIPKPLRGYIAKGLRYDSEVEKDRAKIAALGDHRVADVPVSDFPKYFLHFCGRVAYYRFCAEHLPGEEDAMLLRSCVDPCDVDGARTWLSHQDPEADADAVFRIACQGQNKPRDMRVETQPPRRRCRIAPF